MEVSKSSEINDLLLRPGSQLHVISKGEKYLRSFSEIISRLSKEQGKKGILVSTLWSANALSRRISITKLPKGSLKVIDTISLSLGSNPSISDDFIFLSTPVSLELILMEVERLLISQKGQFNFLIMDSLSYLSRYYTPGQLSEFFHFLLNRMLEEEMLVVIFDQDGGEGSLISRELSSAIDQTVTISDGGDGK
jgi:hypothetical protein